MAASVSLRIALENHINTLDLISDEYATCDYDSLVGELTDIRTWRSNRVPITVVAENILTISRFLDEPLLGIKVTNRLDFSSMPVMSLLRQQFPETQGALHLGEMIIFLSHFFSTLTEVVSIRLTWQEERLCMNILPSSREVTDHQLEGAILGVTNALYYLTRRQPEEVMFAHSNRTQADCYKPYFNLVPKFNCVSYRIVYVAKQRLGALNDAAINAVSGLSLILQNEFPEANVVDRCKLILRSILHFGEPSRERVSGMMRMSVSSLQRRLRENGESFRNILLCLRKELAKDMLIGQGLTATQTAFLLGYHSEVQFFRAFKQWYGVPPGTFRANNADDLQ